MFRAKVRLGFNFPCLGLRQVLPAVACFNSRYYEGLSYYPAVVAAGQ